MKIQLGAIFLLVRSLTSFGKGNFQRSVLFLVVFVFFSCGDSSSSSSDINESENIGGNSAVVEDFSSAMENFSSSVESFSLSSEMVSSSSTKISISQDEQNSSSNTQNDSSSSSVTKVDCDGFPEQWKFLNEHFICREFSVNGRDSVWIGVSIENYDFARLYLFLDFDITSEESKANAFVIDLISFWEGEDFEQISNMSNVFISQKKGFENSSLFLFVESSNGETFKDYREIWVEIHNYIPQITDVSSSSAPASSSSEMKNSSSEVSSCSSAESSGSTKYSSSMSSSSIVLGSSSSWFAIPSCSSITKPREISLAEVDENLKECLWKNLFITNNFRFNYKARVTTMGVNSSSTLYFVSKGKDKIYYEENGKIVDIINGNRHKSGSETVTQEYIDSVRTVLGFTVTYNPLDSGVWGNPIQVSDSLFRLDSDDGSYFYYNVFSKRIEMYWTSQEKDGILVDQELRYGYDELGYVNMQRFNIVSHTSSMDVSVVIISTITQVQSSEDVQDSLFEF
ncbi:MAG: hypothetical protein HUK20_12940 [Fibrobacter sp.]|nr:hypothetical protein [Fibrobacter sp.]